MIGQQNDLTLVLFVPNHHPSEDMRTVFLGLDSVEPDQLITEHIAGDGDGPLLSDAVVGVFLHSGDEVDAVLCPGGKEFVVIVAPIHGDNRTWRKRDFPGNGHIMLLPVGNVSIGREVPIMIQQKVEFDCPFGPSERGPREKRQAKGDGCAVQRKELVLESELPFLRRGPFAKVKGLVEQGTEHLPRPMHIGVGESRFLGCIFIPRCLNLPWWRPGPRKSLAGS